MASYVIFSMVFLMTTLVYVDGAKKLPSGLSQHLYCHGCKAVLNELTKQVPSTLKKGRDVAIVEAMENICTNANFVSYQYSPPKTVKACKALLEEYEEDIETALRENVEEMDLLICHEISGACDGVDLADKDAKFSDIDLTKDGQDDGPPGAKSVKIDPSSGNVVKDAQEKNEGKTLSKSDKKKKAKKSKKGDGKKEKKTKEAAAAKPGTKKGAIHNLNIDINDPSSLQKVMDQINKIKNTHESDDEKDEL